MIDHLRDSTGVHRQSESIPSIPGQLRVHRLSSLLFLFHPVACRSMDSERKTVATRQVTQPAGAVMDEAAGLQQSSADLSQHVSECLSARSLLHIQTEEFRAVRRAGER
ncbi:hypothetical protein PBY51_015583 [Eleginops maclovinus]|uniref:Uncharacterized protein n=1 Tax=Eleginops maclovinus TaxID=56733 RepID=A0AAN7XNU9_ELEMC|nr:hypothetical protein PBY51_015583 [Eleginops maclovinus]